MTLSQLESVRAARLQLLDHGDEAAAKALEWAVSAEATPTWNEAFADWMLHGIEISGEAADGFKLNAAVRDVLVERQRQVSLEGWTPEHDDEHGRGEMAVAAACYAAFSNPEGRYTRDNPPPIWPWASDWWKPSDPRRNLVKAGALILAEIERLDRAANKKDS